MRVLTILLCSLLVLAPAQGQQLVRQNAPNFYVPYGVRDLPVAAIDEEYSSSETRLTQPDSVFTALPGVPMPRNPHPVRGRRSRQHGPNYGAFPQPGMSATGVLITLGVIAAVLGGCAIATMQ